MIYFLAFVTASSVDPCEFVANSVIQQLENVYPVPCVQVVLICSFSINS